VLKPRFEDTRRAKLDTHRLEEPRLTDSGMTGGTIKSVFVKTAPSEIEDDDNLGYELQKDRGDYKSAIIIQETEMRDARVDKTHWSAVAESFPKTSNHGQTLRRPG